MASTEFSKVFSERLKGYRERAGFATQGKLADALGIAQATVGNWESGRNTPTLSQTVELASVLRISVSELIGEREGGAHGRALEAAVQQIARDVIMNAPVDHLVSTAVSLVLEEVWAEAKQIAGSGEQGSLTFQQLESAVLALNDRRRKETEGGS